MLLSLLFQVAMSEEEKIGSDHILLILVILSASCVIGSITLCLEWILWIKVKASMREERRRNYLRTNMEEEAEQVAT